MWRDVGLVAVGGAIGTAARAGLTLAFGEDLGPALVPVINVVGAFAIGVLYGWRARMPESSRAQRVQLFTGGLLPPLSLDVQVHNPQSLAAAMSLARQMELREQYTATATAPPKAAPRGLLPAPQPRPALTYPQSSKPATPNVTVEGRPVKRLNQAKQDERRRLGLCFNYDERYSRGHNKGV